MSALYVAPLQTHNRNVFTAVLSIVSDLTPAQCTFGGS